MTNQKRRTETRREFRPGDIIDAPGTAFHGLTVGSPEANRLLLKQAWRPALTRIANDVFAEKLMQSPKFRGPAPLYRELERQRRQLRHA